MSPKKLRELRRRALEFVLEFARINIAALNEEEWRALRERLAQPGAYMVAQGDGDLTQAEGARLAHQIQSGLRAMVERGELWSPPLSGKLALLVGLRPPLRRFVASPADAFLLNVADLIGAEAKRLRVCARPQCPRLFVANKRGLYCSVACSRARRFARFVRRHGVKKLRARRRARYLQMLEKTKGKAVADFARRRKRRRERYLRMLERTKGRAVANVARRRTAGHNRSQPF